jgi:hypothetical protein
MGSPRFYEPTREGAEAEIAERLKHWRRMRRGSSKPQESQGG